MKKISLLSLLVFISIFVFSQNNFQDVVFLKNGGIIRGLIIEQTPNVSLKIETSGKNVFVYSIDEIEKITKEIVENKNAKNGLLKGYKGIAEIAYQMGVGDIKADNFKFNFINGYQFNPYFSLGLGVGLRIYDNQNFGNRNNINPIIAFPIFADFKINFIDNKISPYISVSPGYSHALTHKGDFDKIGFLFGVHVGISMKTNYKSAFNIGFGFERQRATIFYYEIYDRYNRVPTTSLNYLSTLHINFGFSF